MSDIDQLTVRQKVLLVSPQLPSDEHIVAGATALRIIDQLTTPPDFGVEHKLLVDWINSLPEPFRGFVHALETNADPSGNIRDAVCQRENAEALAARVRELEQSVEFNYQARLAAERHGTELERQVEGLVKERDEQTARAEAAESQIAGLRARIDQLNESNDCFMQSSELANAEADRSKARVGELEGRIAEALRILATPGTWSEFAARARKALTE